MQSLSPVASNNKHSINSGFRQKRFDLFLKTFNPVSTRAILDVGGTSHTWAGSGLENNVTLLNLTSPKPEDIEMGFKAIQGDACNMEMFSEQQFDIVFSNSVIEHVGKLENQIKFAKEVKRVGKSYWVQTPDKYFPVEPHFLFPFFQFLPKRSQRFIAPRWKYSHYKRWNHSHERILQELSQIRLLTRKELRSLFDDAAIYKEKAFGLTKSLVAYKPTQ